VFLADSVHVLSPRPARVVARVEVDLPRPRGAATFESPRFAQLEREVLRRLGLTQWGTADVAEPSSEQTAGPAAAT
jgi:ABC-type nitrate/sulfonate/bicarbonate transport system ATPase subunit